EFVPELKELIHRGESSGDPEKKKAASELASALKTVLEGDHHKWFLGKMDPAEKARRKKATEEFKNRYGGEKK
ncbi:MAG: multiheme c-type cytochrome, partial [Planctomycetota bacterium]